MLFIYFLLIFPFCVCVCCFALRLWQLTLFSLQFLVFFKGVLLSVRQRKGFQQFERCFAPFFPFPPPMPFFQKHSRFFIFFCLFFSSVIPFNIPCFFHQPLFRYYSRFVSLALWTDRSERPRLENTFSYHMGLRRQTWEDGPQSAVFSACLHPEFNMNLCYKRSGIDKRVVFQKGGFGGQDSLLALGLLFFGFLSPFDLEKKNHGCFSL